MNLFPQRLALPMGLAISVALVGCQGKPNPITDNVGENSSTSKTSKAATEVENRRLVIAEKAKDALFKALSGRLMEVMQTDGPVAAINVCSQEATKIADSVGKEQGVAIGRTSFKLRNPANAPREWVKPFVEQRADTRQHIPLDGGDLGVMFPIHLDVKCLMCHGGPEDILDAVKPELAKRYPDDEATGFKQGDLRGWFWVEVPPLSEG